MILVIADVRLRVEQYRRELVEFNFVVVQTLCRPQRSPHRGGAGEVVAERSLDRLGVVVDAREDRACGDDLERVELSEWTGEIALGSREAF